MQRFAICSTSNLFQYKRLAIDDFPSQHAHTNNIIGWHYNATHYSVAGINNTADYRKDLHRLYSG